METILILEDHRHMRELLSSLMVDVFLDCKVTEASTLQQTRRHLQDQRFSIAVIDMCLPDGYGTEIIREIKQTQPETFCVVVSAYDDDAFLFDALKAGAQGYLLKEHHRDKLKELFRRILKSEPPISPSIARRILKHFRANDAEDLTPPTIHTSKKRQLTAKSHNPKEQLSFLTRRETDVLSHIAKGMTCAETGDSLGIKRSTVAGYVKTIYQKLNISSRAEAALEAERMGLFDD